MKFSSTAQAALAASKSYAEQFKSRYAGTEHLLLGLIESDDKFLDQTFTRLEVDIIHLKDIVISILNIEETNKLFKADTGPAFTPRVLRIIDFAKGLAEKLEKNTVDVIHLFLSLLYENDGVATSILMEYGLNFDNVKKAFIDFANKVPFYGAVAVNMDDQFVREILPKIEKKVIKFGIENEDENIKAHNIK